MAKRYIDAEELLQYKEREVVDADKINPQTRYVVDAKYIQDMPAADVVERKRGEWIYEPPNGFNGFKGDYLCSCCKYPVGIQKQNFCPNCGADMREDGHDD